MELSGANWSYALQLLSRRGGVIPLRDGLLAIESLFCIIIN